MALMNCYECGREISDQAVACPGCGAPTSSTRETSPPPLPPSSVSYDQASDTFVGSMALVVQLAMRAVQKIGWKLENVNESIGLITFETGMSWGSWSGVSCSLSVQEIAPNRFRVSGTAKQNVRGGQVLALDLFGEAKGKAARAIATMKELASWG